MEESIIILCWSSSVSVILWKMSWMMPAWSEQNQSYFRKLSGVFYEIEKEINQSDNSSLARKVQKMLAEESLDSEKSE